MKKWMAFVVALIAASFLGGCADEDIATAEKAGRGAAQSAIYHSLTSYEAKSRMEKDRVVLVDVREAEEFASEHLPGAVNVPLDRIGKKPPAPLGDKNAVVLLYCRTGKRSREAADKLVTLGYTQVYDIGGIINWPFETVGGEAGGRTK